MKPIHEVEETMSAVAMLLTTYGPDNPDVHRVAKAVQPIVSWHQQYINWRLKSFQTAEQKGEPDKAASKETSGRNDSFNHISV